MAHALPESLRILCFGASITAGFSSFGLCFYPYATTIQARLHQYLPSAKIAIDVDGLSGDTVVNGQYHSRIKPRCTDNKDAPNDWVIVQGGGNDLGWGTAPEEIYEGPKKVWKVALDSNTKVLALTVTETSSSRKEETEKRNALNDMIRRHQEPGYYVADVWRAVPYESMDEAMRKRIWDDGLHFKKDGYGMLGNFIADRMIEILHSSSETDT